MLEVGCPHNRYLCSAVQRGINIKKPGNYKAHHMEKTYFDLPLQKDGDNIFVERSPDNKKIISVLINNKNAEFQLLKGDEYKRCEGFLLIQKDLELCEAQFEQLLNIVKKSTNTFPDRRNSEYVICKSLFEAACIGYMKCFTTAKGRGVKLEANDHIEKKIGREYTQVHDKLKDLRNNHLAHAGKGNQGTTKEQ